MGRWLLAATFVLLVAGVLAACGELPESGVGAGADDDAVLTLGKRSAPWPDEVTRSTHDGLVEVLETDAAIEEAWAALEPEALPTGGDAATSLEEGAHLPPGELADEDRVLMRVRHVESGSCPVRVADLAGDPEGLTLTLDDSDPRACTDDANPFTALIAVDAARLPPADELPNEVDAGEHWTLALRRVSAVDDLAGTTDPAHDAEPRRGGLTVEPSTAAPGDELAVAFPEEDPDHRSNENDSGAPAPDERGVLFTLEVRSGDTWQPETHLISDRDPDGGRASSSPAPTRRPTIPPICSSMTPIRIISSCPTTSTPACTASARASTRSAATTWPSNDEPRRRAEIQAEGAGRRDLVSAAALGGMLLTSVRRLVLRARR